MSDYDFESDSDREVSENHSKLLDAIRQLDKGQRIKKIEQYEPTLEVSEFSTVKTAAETLDQKSVGIDAKKIKSKLKRAPLEKVAAEKIQRSVGFENTRKELGKWAGIIARNRTATTVSFPLSKSSIKIDPVVQYTQRFRIQSELEKELAALEEKKEEPKEEKDDFPLTLEEILEKRREAAKFRAQQSYKAAKAMREKKIKSKKYHRIQRKERIKKTLKEFEELQKTDPQAALDKLKELDKTRAQERMTLRHRSTGQWAKNKQIRAKYDKETRQVLAEQLAISRELTQKVKRDADSEEDDENDEDSFRLTSTDKENPWMNGVKSESEIDQFVSNYRKFWDEKNKSNKKNQNTNDKDISEGEKVVQKPELQKISKDQNPVEEVIEEYPSDTQEVMEENVTKSEYKKKNLQKSIKDKRDVQEVPKYKNPVEAVIEKQPSDVEETLEENLTKAESKKKNLQKSTMDKLGIKSTKNKIAKAKKSKEKAGTSSWSVSTVESATTQTRNGDAKDIDIDELFDDAEDRVLDKANKKATELRRILDRETENEKKRKAKRNQRSREPSNVDDLEKLALKGQRRTVPILDKPMEEITASSPTDAAAQPETNTAHPAEFNKEDKPTAKTEIDPNIFMNMKPKKLNTLLPDEAGDEDGAMDDDEEVEDDQQRIISEAFADDDVVDEFRRDKDEEIKKSQPEDLDLRLPGWGSWGGKNVKAPIRRKRRFIVKFPKKAPRRDENKGDVVIIEEKCPKIKRHLVSELPFPFSSVQDYEASIRMPIGRDFVPENNFERLVQPTVRTKAGTVIEPMGEDALVRTGKLKRKSMPAKRETVGSKKKKKTVKKVEKKVEKKRKQLR